MKAGVAQAFTTAVSQVAVQLGLAPEEFLAYAGEDTIGGYAPVGHVPATASQHRTWPAGSVWESEGQLLYCLARALKPQVIVEVGSYLGCATSHLALACQRNGHGKVIAVDRHSDFSGVDPLLRSHIVQIQRDIFSWLPDEPFDFLLEDGTHAPGSTQGVLERLLPYLREGGLICCHDYYQKLVPQVQVEFDAVLERAGATIIPYLVQSSDCGLALARKVKDQVKVRDKVKDAGDLPSDLSQKPAPSGSTLQTSTPQRSASQRTTPLIVDCFLFYNELELLEIRLEELKDVVDWFVLVEARETFSGKPKDYVFAENRERFTKYNICYIKIPGFPPGLSSPWQREAFSRNAMGEGLRELRLQPDDIVLLSDVDEIPRAGAVRQCVEAWANGATNPCFVLDQDFFYYYFNCKATERWRGTRVARHQNMQSPQGLRASDGQIIPDAGWHFSFLGGPGRIQEKIGAYSHTEFDRPEYTDVAHIERCLSEAQDLFGRDKDWCYVPVDDSYPGYLLEQRDKFAHLIGEHLSGKPRIGRRLAAGELFLCAAQTPGPVNEHLDFLYRLASTVNHVTQLGAEVNGATAAFIYARPHSLNTYGATRPDAVAPDDMTLLEDASREMGVDFKFLAGDVKTMEIEPTDLLFMSFWNAEGQNAEGQNAEAQTAETQNPGEEIGNYLRRHAAAVRQYLVLHGIDAAAQPRETGNYRGAWPEVAGFMRENSQWRLHYCFLHNNGLYVFMRVA